VFFQRLEDLRVDHDLTIKSIGQYLQMHPGVYSRYEKGIREIPVWALIKLSDLYGVSTDYILGLTDHPNRNA
jgi:transcriptional regulator with XRE-family HTH domain